MTSTDDGGSFSYDANGNMTSRRVSSSDPTYTQTWDYENRLTSATASGETTTFTYDGNGAVAKKATPAGITFYVGSHYEVSTDSTNLVSNPGFESGSGSWSEITISGYPGTSFYRSTWGTAEPHGGSYGYALSNQAYGVLQSDPIAVSPNTQYDLYAYLRGEIDADDTYSGGWVIRATFYDSGGGYLSRSDAAWGNAGSLSPTWQQKGGRITTPSGAATMRIQLHDFQTSGWVAFDDVSLTEAITTSYYYLGGQRVAQRRVDEFGAGVLYWLAADHLGTTSLVLCGTPGGCDGVAEGEVVAESRHLPYGEERWSSGTLPTDYRFTGQLFQASLGIYRMGARWYDPALGRWLSADTIVPEPGEPQDFNRYSYVGGNPLKLLDSSGRVATTAKLIRGAGKGYGPFPYRGSTQISWKTRYSAWRGRSNFLSGFGLMHGRHDVRNHRATITALTVDFDKVDPILVAASIAHQASDILERPFGCEVCDEAQAGLGKLLGRDTSKGIAQLRQQEVAQLVGPGADPYNPTDAVSGMYAKLAQANAKISAYDSSIGMTDRYMLLAIAQNSNAGNPIDYFFGEGKGSWAKMRALDRYGDKWTFQLRQILLHLEWMVAQGWWELPEGMDLVQWREIAFSE